MSTDLIAVSRLRSLRSPIDAGSRGLRATALAFGTSRLIVLMVGMVTAATASVANRAWSAPLLRPFLHPFSGWPLGGVIDAVVSPFVRGDATYFSAIAYGGYHYAIETSFFPGFPLAVRALGGFASPAATVLVGVVVSLATFAGALYVLYRLTALELGDRVALVTLLMISLCPVAVFFSTPYTESLFLFLSVSAFYAARTDRWALAAIFAAGAASTRNVGIFLIAPLLLLYLQPHPRYVSGAELNARFPRRRPGRRLLWLLLAPVGPVLYSMYLKHSFGDPLIWVHSQQIWGRRSAMPWQTVIDGARAAWHVLEGRSNYDGAELVDFAFLAMAAALVVATLRRLPLAYGIYSLAVLLPGLLDPITVQPPQPLHGFPRYVLVTFPLFMALAAWSEQRRVTRWVLLVFSLGLVAVTAAFAAWLKYY